MTENAYTTIDERRLWAVNQLIGLDREDLAAELTGTRTSPAPVRRGVRAARRVARLRRCH